MLRQFKQTSVAAGLALTERHVYASTIVLQCIIMWTAVTACFSSKQLLLFVLAMSSWSISQQTRGIHPILFQILGQRRRRWANIDTALGELSVFAV